jgi:hypothetical protein
MLVFSFRINQSSPQSCVKVQPHQKHNVLRCEPNYHAFLSEERGQEQYQHCCVHVSRNIAHKVRVKDRKEICDDFKAVYQASSKEEANTFGGNS